MQTITAKAAKKRLGEVWKAIPDGPVLVTHHGRPLARISMPGLHSNKQSQLDHIKHRIACEVLSRFSVAQIKKKSLENLARWRGNETWGQAYEEWEAIIANADDHVLIATMVGWSDKANRLRQSPPYVGMLDQDLVRDIREKTALEHQFCAISI